MKLSDDNLLNQFTVNKWGLYLMTFTSTFHVEFGLLWVDLISCTLYFPVFYSLRNQFGRTYKKYISLHLTQCEMEEFFPQTGLNLYHQNVSTKLLSFIGEGNIYTNFYAFEENILVQIFILLVTGVSCGNVMTQEISRSLAPWGFLK